MRWGLGAAAIAVAWFVVVPFAAPGLALAGLRVTGWASLALSLAAYLAAAGFVVAVSRTRGLRSLAADFGFVLRPIDAAIGLAAAVVLEIVRVLLGAAVLPLFRSAPVSNVHLSADPALNGGLGVLAVVIAPIVEELITRGLLLRAVRNAILRRGTDPTVRRRRAAVVTSIGVSALVFTALHLHEAPDAVTATVLVVTILPIGLVNAWLATRTGRLGPGIVVHALLNAVALVVALTSA